MRSLARRLRFAFRTLRNARAFSLLVLVILALGIGANTAVFSVVEAVLLRPLPYGDANRLVVVWDKNPALGSSIGERVPTSYANFAEWVRQAHAFDEIAGFESANFNRTGVGEPERVDGARVSPNFFRAFSVGAALGTTFDDAASDPSRAHVAMLSDGYWKSHFSGDPNVVGKSITLNESIYTIVGVLPSRFYLPAIREGSDQRKPDIWLPYDASALGSVQEQNRRRMLVFGRLRSGVSIDQARAEMHGVAKQLQDQNPTMNAGFDINIFPISAEDVDPELRRNLLVLLSAVGLVLLIACANISNLVLGRAAQRQRELAIRKALGASRADLIAQMLAESAVLSFLGGVLAIAVAYGGIRTIAALKPVGLVRPEQIHLGGSVLVFTMLVSFLAAALFGILPAIRVSRVDVNAVLKSASNVGSADRRHISSALVVTEVALATVLLIGAGFMIRSLQYALNVDPGFHPDQVLTMQLSMPPARYASLQATAAFCRDVLSRISSLPGVKAASFSDGLPMTRIRMMKFMVEGQPGPQTWQREFR